MNFKTWVDEKPIQLWLTLVWATVGVALCLKYQSSILWVGLISVYAIVISHWTAYLAWKAKRAAEETKETAGE